MANISAVCLRRLEKRESEIRTLLGNLYGTKDSDTQSHIDSVYSSLLSVIEDSYADRPLPLRERDLRREQNPDWYKGNALVGMCLYIDKFATNINGVRRKLDYIRECKVNCIHLMPFLDTPKGKSDGGYAVRNFRKVREDLGNMEDLEGLTTDCHDKGMVVCADFVLNHTSSEHEWAKRALAGDKDYMSRYFFYSFDDPRPLEYDKTVPQVFPITAPGNFTILNDGRRVMTTFYPYQWDLDYRNPVVLCDMIGELLYLCNKGIDIMRLDAVPYIWKKLGTQCRNLPEVHSIVRIIRIVCEIVAPSVLLLGEVVMEPQKVAPYFGSIEAPECHLLYNVTTMATIWHTVATRDVRLLRRVQDTIAGLPRDYVFLNYLRCHDDIGWGLDYAYLWMQGQEERAHKHYLNEYFLGRAGFSNSRGALYNDDPRIGDARFCGTTASMCGLEVAEGARDIKAINEAVRFIVMLHAYMIMLSGVPMLYSGDEIGTLNDYSYKDNPDTNSDSRYIHRGALDSRKAARAQDTSTTEGRIYSGIKELIEARGRYTVFDSRAIVRTLNVRDAGDNVICIERTLGGESVLGVYNFSEHPRVANIECAENRGEDMLSYSMLDLRKIELLGRSFRWLRKI